MPRARRLPAAASQAARSRSWGPKALRAPATPFLKTRTATCGPCRSSSDPETTPVSQRDLHLSDGRGLHIYDTHADDAAASLAIFWHHRTPNLGEPPEPLLPAAARRGIRWVSYDRP